MWCESKGLNLFLCTWIASFLAHFGAKIIVSPMSFCPRLSKFSWPKRKGFISGFSIKSHWSVYMFFMASIAVFYLLLALFEDLKLWSMSFYLWFFFLLFYFCGALVFRMPVRISLCMFSQRALWISQEITLWIYVALWTIAI